MELADTKEKKEQKSQGLSLDTFI